MEKKPQVPQTYDVMFNEDATGGVFGLPYRRSPYFPLFKSVLAILRRQACTRVLEVGCGTGTMAHLLQDSVPALAYRGFDFSPVAIEKARQRTQRPHHFFVGDATSPQTYAGLEYQVLLCTEVLEHIEDDLGAMRCWAPGTYCICSVPNYDADTHVRHFRDEQEVRDRYGALLEIEGIVRRRKPFLNDLSARNWLRALKWNRYRPDRLKWLFGMSDFDRDGGWFIFHGKRRPH